MTRTDNVAALEAKIDALTAQVAILVDAQSKQSELLSEAGPILKEVMAAGTERLQDLEERGYFAFGKKALGLIDRVVQTYGEDDLEALTDSVVGILDTVRNLTQSDMLAMANDATEVISHADEVEPVGPMGLLKATKDEDVQKGMAVMVEVLRHVGRSARRSSGGKSGARRRRLNSRLAPSKGGDDAPSRAPSTRPARKAPPKESAPAPVRATGKTVTVPGVALTDDGFLADPASWTPEIAAAIAAAIGVPELGERHWKAIQYARDRYLETGVSPNIRAITKGSGVTTKELYGLFPTAPGKATARCAGIPKPAGCI